MADIRSFLSSSNRNSKPINPTPPLVIIREAPVAPAEDFMPLVSPQCSLPCCDMTTDLPTRLQIDKSLTVNSSSDGKRKRYFNRDWLIDFKWLVVCKTSYKGYCQICRYAVSNKLITFSKKGEPAFISGGFCSWNKGKRTFQAHQNTDFHQEALLKTTQLLNADSVIAQLSDSLKKTQKLRFDCLLEHLECIKLLARNGLSFRNVEEEEGNLRQLLQHSARHVPHMNKYLEDNHYLSHQITSEILEEMYREIMSELIANVKAAGFFSIVIDETQDISGKEQCAIVLRYVDEEYIIHEDLIGLFLADKCDAESLTEIIKTVLLSLDLNILLLRGQTYDGASVLQGYLSGVAKRVKDIIDKALSVHCLNHNLNLILQEAAKVNTIVSSSLSTIQQVCNIIRNSPKRLAVFNSLQSGTTDSKSIKPLCPTRWTCRTASLESVLHNYITVTETLEWIMKNGDKKSEGVKQAPGVLALLDKFGTLFGLRMCLSIFSPVEQFAKQLQTTNITAQTVLNIKNSLSRHLSDMRSAEYFEKLYNKCLKEAAEHDIGMPADSLPRQRRAPKKLNDYYRVDACATSVTNEFDSTQQYFRQAYYETLDVIVRCLNERFDQKTLQYLNSVEELIINSMNGDLSCSTLNAEDLKKRFPVLEGDIVFEQLIKELPLLYSTLKSVCPQIKKVTSIDTVTDFMNHAGMKQTFSQFDKLLKLYLTIPMSNATSERAFSTLRRVKNYLRSRVTQRHLNHYVIMHAHKKLADGLDLVKVAKRFVNANEKRIRYFGKV